MSHADDEHKVQGGDSVECKKRSTILENPVQFVGRSVGWFIGLL